MSAWDWGGDGGGGYFAWDGREANGEATSSSLVSAAGAQDVNSAVHLLSPPAFSRFPLRTYRNMPAWDWGGVVLANISQYVRLGLGR